jgi:O-antigen ligase
MIQKSKEIKGILINLPFLVFGILIFSLPFGYPPITYYRNLPIQLTDILFPLNGALWLLFLFWGKNKVRFSWFYLPLFLYFFSLCLSTYFSEDPSKSIAKLLGSSYLIGLAVLAFNLTDEPAKLVKVIWSWLLATFLVCLICLISLIFFYLERDSGFLLYTLYHYGSLPAGNYPRIQSVFANPNLLSNYLNISVVYLLFALKENWLRKSLIVLSILLTIATFLTFSPGIGGVLLVVGLWGWLNLRKTKPFLSKIILSLGIFSAVLFFLVTLVSFTNFPHQIEPSVRVLTWQSAWGMIWDHPLIGRGIGLETAHVSFQSPNSHQELGDAHQLWLSIFVQQGMIGLVGIISLMGWLLYKSIPLKLDTNISALKAVFGLAFIGAFCYQGLSGSFEDTRHLWVMLGLLASTIETKDQG